VSRWSARTCGLVAIVLALAARGVCAQNTIASIDFFGLRTVTDSAARAVLDVRVGDTLSPALSDAKARLLALPGVTEATIDAVCCFHDGIMLYVGVAERGARRPTFDPAPTDSVFLPADVLADTRGLFDSLMAGIRAGQAGEDDSQGHALFAYPGARAIQERFIRYAGRDLPRLRAVLHHSLDAEERAAAAEVTAYAVPKAPIVPDLLQAMRDPDPTVRNNAARALGVMRRWGADHPEARIDIPLGPFVALLNSPVWTDRNKASLVVAALTERRDSADLALLRREALPALVEMARWRNPGHAGAPFLIVGRIAGWDDEALVTALKAGDREPAIRAALATR